MRCALCCAPLSGIDAFAVNTSARGQPCSASHAPMRAALRPASPHRLIAYGAGAVTGALLLRCCRRKLGRLPVVGIIAAPLLGARGTQQRQLALRTLPCGVRFQHPYADSCMLATLQTLHETSTSKLFAAHPPPPWRKKQLSCL